MASHYVHLAQSQIEERVRKDAQLDPLGARIQADPHRAIADVASAAAASSSAAVIKALMDAGVLPKPGASATVRTTVSPRLRRGHSRCYHADRGSSMNRAAT